MWILAIGVPAAIHMRAAGHRDRSRRSEIVLMYILGVSGAIGMFNAVMHTVFADDVAASIGWPAGNPFQTEVGFANLAIGMIGFACFWRYDFWLPAVDRQVRLRLGCRPDACAGHRPTGNVASNNAGPILAWDFLLPVVMIAPLHPRPTGARSGGNHARPLLVDPVATGSPAGRHLAPHTRSWRLSRRNARPRMRTAR